MPENNKNREQPSGKRKKVDNELVFSPSVLKNIESLPMDSSNGLTESDMDSGNFSKISQTISESKKWLLTSEIAWATTLRGKQRKISNTVGGLFCLLYSNNKITISEQYTLNDSVEFLVSNTTENGLKALSLDLPAVHCTAMTLFVISKMIEKGILARSADLNESLRLMKVSLINSASDIGWGFENTAVSKDNAVRPWSTLWALRALNAVYPSLDDGIKNKLRKICSRIVHSVPSMALGFTYKDGRKVSISALFMILISELGDMHLKEELQAKPEFRNVLRFILSGLHSSRHVEFEEYSYFRNGVEKLSWTHISAGLGIHALSLNKIFLNSDEKDILRKEVNEIIGANFRHSDDGVGFFCFDQLSSDKNDYLIFPTADMIAGLYFYLYP